MESTQPAAAIDYDQLLFAPIPAVLEVPDRIDVIQWVESKRHLSTRADESGPMRLSRTPYARPWLEAAVDDTVEEIIICASAQVAKTTFAESIVGYYADVEKATILFTLADENTAKFIVRDRVRKMFAESPELKHLIDGATVDNAGEIELSNGAYIGIAWASSVAALATKEFRVVIGDEIDKAGYYVRTREATALSLLRERTESYFDFKRIFFSTPSIDTGNVTVELDSCDVVFDWHIPCPYCGQLQPLRFSRDHAHGFKKGIYRDRTGKRRKLGRVVWPGGSKASPSQLARARYECGSCKKRWTTAQKNRAVGLGESVPRKAIRGAPKKVGYHINRLYSLLGKSGHIDRLVAAFIRSKKAKDPRVLQGFINSSLAEPWNPTKKTSTTARIMALADDRPRSMVPGGGVVACLLAGVDTQDDGFFYEIRAFGFGLSRESWCIQEGKVPTFAALSRVLWENEYKDAEGNVYPVRLAMQDSAGHRTSEVYDFCRANRGRIYPTIGAQTMATHFSWKTIEFFPNGKTIPGGVRLYRINTNFYKDQLAGILEIKPGDPGCWWYHRDISIDWARQMTVEGINEKGIWENPLGRANHAWDCSVLLLMAHNMADVATWPDPRNAKPKPKKRPQPAVDKITLW